MLFGRATGIAAIAVAVFGAAGCGSTTRSVSSYCHTYAAQKSAYLDKYNAQAKAVQGSSDPLAGALGAAAMSVEAMGDVRAMFDRLDRVAPESIEPDVAAVRDSFSQQLDAMKGVATNPLGALMGGLISGIASSGSFQRVDGWTKQNCGST
ncbi:MAG: hypothetical protein ACJ76I_15800 [Gaiellaceae bacterium]